MNNLHSTLKRLAVLTASTSFLLIASLQPAKSTPDELGVESVPKIFDTSLLGSDSNNNGVRDDLEASLNQRFGEDERGVLVMTNFLISIQYAMASTTREQSRAAHDMYLRAMSCIEGLSTEYRALNGYGLMELSGNLANNSARYKAMKDHFQRVEEMKLEEKIPPTWNKACMKKFSPKGLPRPAKG